MCTSTQKKLVTSVAAAALLFGLAACDNDDAEQQDAAAEQNQQPDEGGAEEPDDLEQPEMPEPDLGDVPDVVAEVNGEDITGEEFSTSFESQYMQMAMQAQMTGEGVDEDALQQQVLDNLIGLELLDQEAEQSGYEVSEEEVDEQLEQLAEMNDLDSVDQVFEIAEEQGLSEEEFREDVEAEVIIEQIVASLEVDDPTDEEVEDAYEQFAAQAPPVEGEDGEESETPDLEELRPQIEEELAQQKESEALMAYVDDLREDAEVEIHI
ncbi:SurA N-terminal domain-containing protein [Nesterenkonia muleiensis]|uniref:SurA N-terminal domain-containing protein n=1 Tax=Nesterenkonia muleiensis TaxID=2282648 RepID=UPI000E770FA7|nr:SurA N-terminal domain-containing protein [Nesterenkonia muleiensis]